MASSGMWVDCRTGRCRELVDCWTGEQLREGDQAGPGWGGKMMTSEGTADGDDLGGRQAGFSESLVSIA